MANPRQPGRSLEVSYILERATKRPCYDQDDIVTVLVGPNEKRFGVHKDVICKDSDFFRAACSTKWLEGREKLVRLPEVKPNVFQVYLDWAYTGTLAFEDAQTPEEARARSSSGIIDVYLLGDVLGDVKLRNQAMQLLNTHVTEHKLPSYHSIRRIFRNTPANSNLRKWVVDVVTMRQNREGFALNAAHYPAEFVAQMAMKLLEIVPMISRNDSKERLSTAEYFEAEAGAPEPEH